MGDRKETDKSQRGDSTATGSNRESKRRQKGDRKETERRQTPQGKGSPYPTRLHNMQQHTAAKHI